MGLWIVFSVAAGFVLGYIFRILLIEWGRGDGLTKVPVLRTVTMCSLCGKQTWDADLYCDDDFVGHRDCVLKARYAKMMANTRKGPSL